MLQIELFIGYNVTVGDIIVKLNVDWSHVRVSAPRQVICVMNDTV